MQFIGSPPKKNDPACNLLDGARMGNLDFEESQHIKLEQEIERAKSFGVVLLFIEKRKPEDRLFSRQVNIANRLGN